MAFFKPSDIEFSDMIDIWFNECVKDTLRHGTRCDYQNAIKNHIKPYSKDAKLKDITIDMLQQYIDENNTGTQIANLITRNGKTGADMTHALKELGGEDMQRGLTRIAEFFLADSAHSLRAGRIQGAVGGSAGIEAIFLVYKLIKSAVKNSKHREEGKAVLNCLMKNLPEKKADDPNESTPEITEVSAQA